MPDNQTLFDLSEDLALPTLIALAESCDYSVNAHAPEGQILRAFATHDRGNVKKMLKKLVKAGYAQKHPTGRNMTYNITSDGLLKAQNF